MEENQQIIIPEKIKHKFLSYSTYSAFKRDLDSGRILDDAIVFIKNVRRIWARGTEYSCNTQVQIIDNTITVIDADGNIIVSEQFPKKSEFEEHIRSINGNVDLISQGLVAEHNRAISEEQRLAERIDRIIQNSTEDDSLTELRTSLNSEVSRIDQRITAEENTARSAESNLANRIDDLQQIAYQICVLKSDVYDDLSVWDNTSYMYVLKSDIYDDTTIWRNMYESEESSTTNGTGV